MGVDHIIIFIVFEVEVYVGAKPLSIESYWPQNRLSVREIVPSDKVVPNLWQYDLIIVMLDQTLLKDEAVTILLLLEQL